MGRRRFSKLTASASALPFLLSLACAIPAVNGESEIRTNALPAPFDSGKLRAQNSKPTQLRNQTGPKSPEIFNPDPPTTPARERPSDLSEDARLRKTVSTNVPPQAPPGFNPDPGVLPSPVSNPLYRTNFGNFEKFSGDPVPPDLALPRSRVIGQEIEPVPPSPPDTFGKAELPPSEKLPRENVSILEKIRRKFHTAEYPLAAQHQGYPSGSEPVTNRWRIGFTPWSRYTRGAVEGPYLSPSPDLWHPYRQSTLKGDLPLIGQDIFLNLTAESTTEFETRRLPTRSGVSAAHPFAAEFYGEGDQLFVQNNFSFSVDLFRGETVFQPVRWAIHLQPVFNVNYIDANETGVVNPDPRGPAAKGGPNRGPGPANGFVTNPEDVGGLLNGQLQPASADLSGSNRTQRRRSDLALQQAFGEIHIGDLSETYDFVAARLGNQVFNSDFRGFIFNDVNFGGRVFGNYDNNRLQYNLAMFDMLEKDSNSELNTFDSRDQRVLVLNMYRQDFLKHGYTTELSFHANFDEGGTHYDRNDNITRPEPIGTVLPHDVRAFYLGWAGDGHIGKLNINHAFYQALGTDEFNGIAGRPVDINAQMAALELSYDRDWVRYKASFFYASGDGNPTDGTARGFDSIVDNPNFTGGPFSYYVRQGFNFGGTAVSFKTRNSLIPSLRTSKNEGQANFVNPGIFIYGVGTEMELTPKLRSFINLNYLRFDETAVLKYVLVTDKVASEIGYDASLGFQYRPWLTDNVIISAGFGALLPGTGYRDIYRSSTDPVPGYNSLDNPGRTYDFLYSGIVALTLTY